MKKKVFYTEFSYLLGLIIMAFGAALTEKADFGMSMVVAPAYLLHLKVSQWLPWFSFGVAEYCFQGLLVLATVIIMRKCKPFYLFSFVTAVFYGTLLDMAMAIIAPLPDSTFVLRILWYVVGVSCCTFAVSLFFHTYLAPEAYELIVKELARKTGKDINKIKAGYDVGSVVLSVTLSFAFFGFGVFRGIEWGTFVNAATNALLIGGFSKLLEHFFEFKNKWDLEKYFR